MSAPHFYRIPDPEIRETANLDAPFIADWCRAQHINFEPPPIIFSELRRFLRELREQCSDDYLQKAELLAQQVACHLDILDFWRMLALLHQEYPGILDTSQALRQARDWDMDDEPLLWLAERSSTKALTDCFPSFFTYPKMTRDSHVIARFLELGADPNADLDEGITATHRCSLRQPGQIFLLWEHGGDLLAPGIFNVRMRTPLSVLQSNHPGTYRQLQAYLADPQKFPAPVIIAQAQETPLTAQAVLKPDGSPRTWILQAAGIGYLPALLQARWETDADRRRLFEALPAHYRGKPEVERALAHAQSPLREWRIRAEASQNFFPGRQ